MTGISDRAAHHPSLRLAGWAIGGSVVLHGLLLAVFVVMTFLEPSKLDLAQKPISAKLVRLGTKRDEHLLPRKEVSAPPPPQPVASPASQPVTIRAREPKASVPSTTASKPSSQQIRRDLFRAFDKTARKEEAPSGDPQGDPNGDSDTADEGERYFGLILAKARRNYGVTKTIPPQELIRLKATVVIYIGATGDLLKDPELQVSSGNEQFDQDVILSLKKAAPFGPPPPHLAGDLRTVGVAFQVTP